jgi:hypothetical protein
VTRSRKMSGPGKKLGWDAEVWFSSGGGLQVAGGTADCTPGEDHGWKNPWLCANKPPAT